MGKGIIKVSNSIVAYWFVAGKRHDDLQEILKLPEQYRVEGITGDVERDGLIYPNSCVDITVSSPDITDVEEGKALPSVSPVYTTVEGHGRPGEDRPKSYELTDILIDGKSTLHEGSKLCP